MRTYKWLFSVVVCCIFGFYVQPAEKPLGDLANQLKDEERKKDEESRKLKGELLVLYAAGGILEKVKEAVSKDVDVNHVAIRESAFKGATALGAATTKGYLKIIKYLLNHGADPEMLSQKKTPLQIAREISDQNVNKQTIIDILENPEKATVGEKEEPNEPQIVKKVPVTVQKDPTRRLKRTTAGAQGRGVVEHVRIHKSTDGV